MNYTWFENLPDLVGPVQADSITSRTIHSDDQVKVVLFGFAAGQALSEHSAAQSAIIHILQGEAALKLGDDTYEAGPGFWTLMPPRVSHSVTAHTPLVMLLTLLQA